nr:hypothetical protein [Tanacetum cinerariifolium]
DQPYVEDASPKAQSPEYVLESDLEAHPEDDDDEDLEEDPEEEHPAPADSVVVASTAADQAPSTDESAATPPPHPAYRMTARISIPAPVPMPAWSDLEVVRLLAMSSPPASPLSPWSSPPPHIPFPPLPPILSPHSPMLSPAPPPSPIRSLGYRAAMIRLRAEAASTSHSPPLPPPFILSPTRSDAPLSGTPLLLPISAFTSSPPLQLPSASHGEDRPKVTLLPRKKLGIALGPRYEVGESSSAAAAAARPAGGLRTDYDFVATMDREIMHDKQTERQLLAGRLNMLFKDRRAHAYTRHLMETEARMSREAWVRSTYASDLVRGEVMSLRTTVLSQMTEIRELHAADRKRQIVISELLRADHRRSTKKQMAPKRTTRSTADHETINATSVTNAKLQEMIDQGVTAALAARDALRSTNGDDNHNSETGVRRTERATRECTYTDFLKCQPLPFKGTEGVASLSQWCERMESNTHVKTVGHEATYGMPWKTLMKMMTDKYYPRNEIKKLEMELWDLKVKGTDLASYTQCYQELALLCRRMFSEESDKIEKYIGGLPDMIHGSVVASKPKMMQEAVEIETELMDKKIRTFAECVTASKRKFENTSRNTQNQQQQSNKRQNTGRVYTASSGEKKQYGGSKPLCAKCNYHHDGPCALNCCNCKKLAILPVTVGIRQIPIMLTIRGALG